MDARRGQCYAQVLACGGHTGATEPQLVALEAMATLGGSDPIVFAGSGAVIAAEAAGRGGRQASIILPELQPDMAHALRAAQLASTDAAPPRPLYLRPPDAKPQDGKTLARIS
jgi:tRNA threonylcarbamoyladenosine biosynthesis protein TsaB